MNIHNTCDGEWQEGSSISTSTRLDTGPNPTAAGNQRIAPSPARYPRPSDSPCPWMRRYLQRGPAALIKQSQSCSVRRLVQAGADAGVFTVTSARLASYAILDLGMGISAWYRETGEHRCRM
jgi:hypothetical protein